MKQKIRWHIYPDVEDLSRRVAAAIENCARGAVRERGLFRIVLAGGNTPISVYEALRDRNAGSEAWHVYFGDERCLPKHDVDRNDSQAQSAWLDYALLPREQIYAIPAELGAAEAATAYADTLAGVERFDLVLLGLGDDGHTASLFTGHDVGSGTDSPDALPVYGAPKPPPERVSLSAHRLSRSHHVFFLVTGRSKSGALQSWRRGGELPARYIVPDDGLDVFADAEALADW